jgi:nucleotide sugar dehydrogenase
MKIGIVGHGFVGSAVNQGFTRDVKKFIVDPKYYRNNTIQDLRDFQPDMTFVCVPTPQSDSGECNTELLQQILLDLNTIKGQLVVVKSTVPAYKLTQIQEQCIDLKIVLNPEFLTEKNYIEDFRNPSMLLLGGKRSDTERVEKIYQDHSVCRPCPVYHTDIVTASMVKYCINSFLATKVTFMNEMHDVVRAAGADWREFVEIVTTDTRIGKSHMQVPGADGSRGYAGSCFPKDTAALAYFAREILNRPFTQLETSIKINDSLRRSNDR